MRSGRVGSTAVLAGAALAGTVLISGCASTDRPGGIAIIVTQSATTQSTTSPSARPCPPAWSPAAGQGVAVDYVDTVHIAGHEFVYQATASSAATPPVLGAELGRVHCQITAYRVDPGYRLQDGDATFLPVGTVLYAMTGQDPAKVVAVRDKGGVRLYRAP